MRRQDPVVTDWPIAVYKKQEYEAHRENPYIEALPKIRDDDEAILGMQNLVRVTDQQLKLSTIHRFHMLSAIDTFMQPLSYHVKLFHRVSLLIRSGYEPRNPSHPDFFRDMLKAVAELEKAAKVLQDPKLGQVKNGVRRRL